MVPVEHPIKGQAIYAFVTLMEGHAYPAGDEMKAELVAAVRKAIGPIATPDVIHWVGVTVRLSRGARGKDGS